MNLSLDDTHENVLKELDKQLESLYNAPLSTPLPPFPESIDQSLLLQLDAKELQEISFQLKKDLKEFEELAQEPLNEVDEYNVSINLTNSLQDLKIPETILSDMTTTLPTTTPFTKTNQEEKESSKKTHSFQKKEENDALGK